MSEGVASAIGTDMDAHHFGGFLRCETCGYQQDMNDGDTGRYLSAGWPKHCGYTMRWWTARQIAANEVPERA